MFYPTSDKDGGEKGTNCSENDPSTKEKAKKTLRQEFNRKMHNYVEKKRKDKISVWINRIAEILPHKVSKKESKNDTLERAYCHMLHLREINDRIIFGNIDKVRAERIRELRKQLKKLEAINAAYCKIFKMSGISLDDLPADLTKLTPNILSDANIFTKLNSDLRPKFSDAESDDDSIESDFNSTSLNQAKECDRTNLQKCNNSVIDQNSQSIQPNNSTMFVVPTSDQKAPKISLSNGSQIQIRPSPNVSVLGNGQLAIQANNVSQGPIVLGSTLLAPPQQQTLLMSNGQLLSIVNQPQPAFVYSPGSGFVLTSAPVSNQIPNLTVPTIQFNNPSVQSPKKKPKTTTTIETVPMSEPSPKKKLKPSPKTDKITTEGALQLNLSDDDGEEMDLAMSSESSKKDQHNTLSDISSNRNIYRSTKSPKDKAKKISPGNEKTDSIDKNTGKTVRKNRNTNQEELSEGDRDRSNADKKGKSASTADISVNQMDYHLMNTIDEYIRNFSPQDFENHANSPRYSSPLTRAASDTGIMASDSSEIIGANDSCLNVTTLNSQNKSSMANVEISNGINKDLTSRMVENFTSIDHTQIDSVPFQATANLSDSQTFTQNTLNHSSSTLFDAQSNRETELHKQKSQDQPRPQSSQAEMHLQKQKSYQDSQLSRNRTSNSSEAASRNSSNNAPHTSSRENISQQTFLPYSAEALIRQQPISNHISSNGGYQLHPSVDTNLEFNVASNVSRDGSGNRTSISYSAERILHSSPGSNVQNDNNRSKNSQSKRRPNISSSSMFGDQFSMFDINRSDETIGSNSSQPSHIQHSSVYRSSPLTQTAPTNESNHQQSNNQMVLISQQQTSRQYPEKSPSNQLHQHQAQHSANSINQHWQDQQNSANQSIQQASNAQRHQTQPQSQRTSHQNTHQTSRRQSPTNNTNNSGNSNTILAANNRNLFNHYPYTSNSESSRPDNSQSNATAPYPSSNSVANEQSNFIDNSSAQNGFQASFSTPSNYPSIRRGSNNNNPFGFSDHLSSSFNPSTDSSQYSRNIHTASTSQVQSNGDSHRVLSGANCDITQPYLINYPANPIQHHNPPTVFSSASSFPAIITSSSSSCFDNNSYLTSTRSNNTPSSYASHPTSNTSQFTDNPSNSSSNSSREISKGSKASSSHAKQSKSSSTKTTTKKVPNKNQGRTAHETRPPLTGTSYSPMVPHFSNVGHSADVNRLDPALSVPMSSEHLRTTENNDNLLRPQSQSALSTNLHVNNIPTIPGSSSSRPGTASGHIPPVGHSSSFLANFNLTNILTDMGPTNLNDNFAFPSIKFPSSNHVLPHTNTGGHLQPNSMEAPGVSINQAHHPHQNLYGHSRISASRHNSMAFGPLIPSTNSSHSAILHDAKIVRGIRPR